MSTVENAVQIAEVCPVVDFPTRIDSGVVEPVACENALDSLRSVVPDNLSGSELAESPSAVLPSRTAGFFRFRQAFLTGLPFVLADVIVVAATLTVATFAGSGGYSDRVLQQLPAVLWFCVLYLISGRIHGLYPGTGTNAVAMLRSQTHSVFYAAVAFYVCLSVAAPVAMNTPVSFLIGIVACGLLLPIARSVLRRLCVNFSWWGERAIVVGTSRNALSILEFLQANIHLGLRPVGVVDDYRPSHDVKEIGQRIRFLGVTRELLPICSKHDCYWVIATTGGRGPEELERFLTVCSLIPNLIVVNDNLPLPSLWCRAFDAAGLAAFQIKDRLLHPLVRLAKRLVDIGVALSLLIVSGPIWLAAGCCIKIMSPGPVLFGHERIGRNCQTFKAWKFRTMVCNPNQVLRRHLLANSAARTEWEADRKLRNDPRIIRGIGNFLRTWSLDELPQLWNVLKGDMTLVGPRPIVAEEAEKYQHTFSLYTRVRPGLTGLWQVSGRNNTTYAARVQLDAYYVRNWSLWLDYYILFRTARAVLGRQGSC